MDLFSGKIRPHPVRHRSSKRIGIIALCLILLFSFRWLLPGPGDGMVNIPAGPFRMGMDEDPPEDSPLSAWGVENAKPVHTVDLPSFDMDRYEVTYGDFKEVFPQFHLPNKENAQPVTNVNWFEAEAYCRAVGKRLPTEAEWEKAARGPDGRLYPWGNSFDPEKTNLGGSPVAAGSQPGDRSPYGVYDMAGNVSEWTDSWYRPYPGSSHHSNDFGLTHKVVRGGSFITDRHYRDPAFAQIPFRYAHRPDEAGPDAGFRCARTIPP